MTLLQLIVLAIVQGLTEFIPVSSSAHLILPQALLEGWPDQGRAIDVAAHVGSLGAVLVYFRRESAGLVRGGVDTLTFTATPEGKLFLFLAVATIPLVIFGGLLAVTGLSDAMRDPRVIATTSIVFGILLWVADRQKRVFDHLPDRWGQVLTIGAAQAIAVIPGTSRSGITVTAARFLGFTREEAARFSMLLAIPAILASGGFETLKLIAEGGQTQFVPIALVALFSFLAAWASIAVFMKMTRHLSFTPFVIYRIALGIVLFAIFS